MDTEFREGRAGALPPTQLRASVVLRLRLILERMPPSPNNACAELDPEFRATSATPSIRPRWGPKVVNSPCRSCESTCPCKPVLHPCPTLLILCMLPQVNCGLSHRRRLA